MDDVLSQPETAGKTPLNRRQKVLLLGSIAAILIYAFTQRQTLVDPPPRIGTLLAASAGALLGLRFSLWIFDNPNKAQSAFQRALGMAASPILCAVVAAWLVRSLVSTIAFAGAHPTVETIEARVLDKSIRKYGGYSANIDFGPGTREVYVPISEGLYDSLEPWREPGRDCLSVHVETGRLGIRRVLVPNSFDPPFTMGNYKPCSQT